MQKKLTYETDTECSICSRNFKVTRTRVGIKFTGMDTDFRMRYENVDPNYYVIWVCPHCGYSAPDDCFSTISDTKRAILLKALNGKEVRLDLQGERTAEQALSSYKLAIYFGELSALPASKMGGLYLKMAWLYRDKGDEELEQRCLAKAAEQYMLAFSNERLPIGKMTETALVYLVANLLDRTGDIKQAARWLSKIVAGKKTSDEAKLNDMARDLWFSIKEKRAALGETDEV